MKGHNRLVLLYLLFTLLLAGMAWAEGPEMVEDIATGPSYSVTGPHQFFTFRGKVLFFASDTSYGPALWSSDGQGASLLGVLCPPCGDAQLMGATSTVAFYAVQLRTGARDTLLGSIWRTDGTRAGTYPVTGILQMPGYPNQRPFVSAVGSRLAYFTACTPEQGCEIWSSDGTAEGTGPVADRVPGPDSLVVHEMVTLGDQAYILGQVRGNMGLWRAESASRTVTRIRGLRSEPPPRLLTVLGNRLFFLAQADGLELWTSDGTTAGTFAVSAYAPADPFLATLFLKPIGGRLHFLADDGAHGIELWSADAGGGLRALTDFRPYYPFGYEGWYLFVPESLESVGGRLLFAANNGRNGLRLWTSRGQAGSTQPLTGCPGGCPEVGFPHRFARLGTRVVFAGSDARHGLEPWISDGTGPGTRLLRDTVPGPNDSSVRAFTSSGNRVFFERYIEERAPVEMWATDGTQAGTVFLRMGAYAESHYENPRVRMPLGTLGTWTLFGGYDEERGIPQLWRSDGAPAGTGAIFAWNRQAGSDPGKLGVFGDHLLFTACRSFVSELRVGGGTAATTDRVAVDLGPCSHPVLSDVVDLNGIGVFRLSREYADGTNDGSRVQIWRSDGTTAGTAPITSFQNVYPGAPVPLADKALFPVINLQPGETRGTSLWVTDGTAAGTQKRVDLHGVVLYYAAGMGPVAYFVGLNDADGLARIWRTDGTAAGTFPVTPAVSNLTTGFGPPEFTRLGNRVYFLVRRPSRAIEIWSTDGTAEGTGPAVTAAAGAAEPDSLWPAGGLLFFRALETGGSRRVLWRTDGTPAGTFSLGADLSDGILTPVSYPEYPAPRFATLGDEVFFQATDGVHGAELWRSDGTREGTVLVKDIFPGIGGSHPLWPVTAGDRIYFSASNGPGGRELWTSEGTTEGTRRVADIAPGPSWSDPQWLTVAGEQLFFTADDGAHGRELWRSPLSAIP
jgi:ELWxxDGT repeat protein